MLTSLNSAVSGLDAFQQEMDIIGNNIANINTTGFKAGNGNLVDSFSSTLQAATIGGTSSSDSMQIGTGVTTASITNDWSQGTINSTGVSSDLAINGNGFFVVQDPTTSNQYVTQDGTFSVNSKGNLVTSTGMYVLGTGGTPIVLAPATGLSMVGYSVSATGAVTVTNSDGSTTASGQLTLQNFQNPGALVSAGGNLYSNMANAGPLTAAVNPGQSGTGTIQSGALELSNVDLSAEMAALITAQRGFEANSKIVTTSDEVLQAVVQMKR
jgi:flagellar hook protein FlgE